MFGEPTERAAMRPADELNGMQLDCETMFRTRVVAQVDRWATAVEVFGVAMERIAMLELLLVDNEASVDETSDWIAVALHFQP
jgi:hypothetical protein